MSPELASLSARVVQLRREFDSTFSQAPSTETVRGEDFLAVRVGKHPYAIRLTDISALAADKVLTPVPVPAPALLGITGFGGSIVSVYDLGVLLGHGAGETHRWLVLTATDTAVGLSFDHFDGHRRVAGENIAVDEGKGPKRAARRAREVLRLGETVLPIIQVGAVVDVIRGRVKERTSNKER